MENSVAGTCSVPGECSSSSSSSAPQCDLWLAPSTIPGAGLGLFTGSDKRYGDVVGTGDLSIPIVDLNIHRGRKKKYNPFHNYHWEGSLMEMEDLADTDDLSAVCPGIDSLVNCHFALNSMEWPVATYDDNGVRRGNSPGFGAFSPYYNLTTTINVEGYVVPAGAEMFKSYGEKYFTYRDDVYPTIPFEEHFEWADDMVITWTRLINKSFGAEDDPSKKKDDAARRFGSDLWDVVDGIRVMFKTNRFTAAMPTTVEEVQIMADAHARNEDGIKALYQPKHTRSMEELKKIGRCMDSIRPGPSTIPDAGHGAFARLRFRRGDVVTASPIKMMRRSMLDIYEMKYDNSIKKWTWDQERGVVHSQLATNYVFEVNDDHYMFAYGNGVNYINHAKGRKANIRLRWVKEGHGFLGHNTTWLERNIVNPKVFPPGDLIMDYVATKPIAVGDELFMDYGKAWQDAWDDHVKKWNKKKAKFTVVDETYTPAQVFNVQMGPDVPLRTLEEQAMDPYPTHVLLECHRTYTRKDKKKKPAEWFAEQDWSPELWYNKHGNYCDILNRTVDIQRSVNGTARWLYDVDIHISKRRGPERHVGIPRSIIRFVNKPYTADLQQRHSFRHPIALPEDMVPDAWSGT